ncbi:MAG: hypothetical protein C4343_00800 [Chloroflexota bacterium]
MAIKRASPFVVTAIAGYSNGSVGYLPTRRAYAEGGYEVTLACLVASDRRPRLAYGSVGPRPYLVTDETGDLLDPGASEEATNASLDRLFAAASPSPRSMRASPEYRLAMLRVLARRAVAAAAERLAREGVR